MVPLRTTPDIIWSCIATLVICVWVSLHPSIRKRNITFLERFDSLEKPHGAIRAFLAPELTLSRAINEWLHMHISLKKIKCLVGTKPELFARNDIDNNLSDHGDCLARKMKRVLWMVPAHLCAKNTRDKNNLKDDCELQPITDSAQLRNATRIIEEWTAAHSMFHRMGGFTLFVNGVCQDSKVGVLEVGDIIFLAGHGYINLKDIGKHISDRSKSNWSSKTVACIQAGWFVSQCIARAVQQLPITEFEMMVVGYVALALLQNWFWWHKPLDVDTKVQVMISDKEYDEMIEWKREIRGSNDGNDVRNLAKVQDDEEHECFSGISGMIFGGIHCLAWNFYFPTDKEKILWRVCSLAVTTIPLVYSITSFLETRSKGWFGRFLAIILFLVGSTYFVARIVLLGEVLLSLRLMPPGVYQTVNWTSFLPHV